MSDTQDQRSELDDWLVVLRKLQRPSPDGSSITQALEVFEPHPGNDQRRRGHGSSPANRGCSSRTVWLNSVVSGSEASAESALMSDFTRWSRWFECGLDLQHEKLNALGMMGWIAAHAASDGSGLEFDANVWASIEDETGLTLEQAKAAWMPLSEPGS